MIYVKIGFNSRLVRLKDDDGNDTSGLIIEFQFQIGAIKGRLAKEYLFQFQIGAIKGVTISIIQILVVSFNSRLVRLKGKPKSLALIFSPCFNSRLVRLKDSYEWFYIKGFG